MTRTNVARPRVTNRDSRIVSVYLGNGSVSTRTIYRAQHAMRANVLTENNLTTLRIRTNNGSEIYLSGAEARTIFRTLRNHYVAAGLSIR